MISNPLCLRLDFVYKNKLLKTIPPFLPPPLPPKKTLEERSNLYEIKSNLCKSFYKHPQTFI